MAQLVRDLLGVHEEKKVTKKVGNRITPDRTEENVNIDLSTVRDANQSTNEPSTSLDNIDDRKCQETSFVVDIEDCQDEVLSNDSSVVR